MKHILMADAMDANLEYAKEILGNSYEMITLKSGEQTLLYLKKIVPDLLLLDVKLPDMSGYEVMEALKEDNELKKIPVIFLTEEFDRESEIKGLKMGAMDYIRKPFEPEVVRSRIEKILQMTDQKKEIQNVALRDGLTALFNRKYMEKLLEQTDTGKEKGFFMLLDLDNFKMINDRLGHVMGDKMIVRLARIMEEQVGADNSVCRLGSDEFAIYFSGNYEKDEITAIAQRLIEEIEFGINELVLDAEEISVSASIGISRQPEDGRGFTELYAAADKALYFVKQNGKGRCHFYQDTAKESKKIENKAKNISLRQIQRMIQEEDRNEAGRVGYNRFKWMYGFITQCMEKKSQDAHVLLLTLQDVSGAEPEKTRARRGIEILEQVMSKSLRSGDIITRCGDTQYIALLLNTSYENGKLAAERIRSRYAELAEDQTMILTYEVGNVGENN